MSLQVWLPLNKKGNFYNQGLLGDINVVNTPSFGSSGKIGSTCMTTGSFKLSAQQTSKVLNNEQFSFASWIYITQASGSTILFGNDNMYAPNNRRFTIFLYNTLQRIHLSWQNYDSNNTVNGSGTMTGDIIPINTWTHITVTYSSSTNKATIYVNGIKYVDYTIGKFTSPTYAYKTTLMENSNTVYYNDYRLYDHCLSPYEVHEIAKGLVLHYPMNDEYVQSTVYDCSGYCNNGQKGNGITVSNDTCRYSKSLNFNGTEGISIGNLYTILGSDTNAQFTFNCWFKKATGEWSSKNWETIFGGPGGFELEMKPGSTNSPTIYIYSWGGSGGAGSFVYPLNQWNMLTMVRTSDSTKFYLNGELKSKGTTGSIPSGNYFIGAWNSISGQTYRGKISDVRIYSTALSEDDIKELYNTSAIINNNNTLEAYEFVE